MSFRNIRHFSCLIHCRPRFCDNQQSTISTSIKVYYKTNKISHGTYIVPTRFELYDDFNLRFVWKLRFLVPIKEESQLSLLLERFARLALATDPILISVGVKDISQCIKEISLLPTDLESLAIEFNMKDIIVLDDETLQIPDGQYENSPNVKVNWNILQHFSWTNWEIQKFKADSQLSKSSSSSDDISLEAVDGSRRGYDTCGNFSFH